LINFVSRPTTFGAIVVEDDHDRYVLVDRPAVGFALDFALEGRAVFVDRTRLDELENAAGAKRDA
jgi:hypothetical protein